MKKIYIPMTLGLAALAVSCTSTQPESHDHSGHNHAKWSYSGANGPEHWGDLDPLYALCKTGKRQSPVDISHSIKADIPKPKYHYSTIGLDVINNGHTIQQNVSKGQYLTLNGKRFNLLQFHFHSKSEHTFKGKHLPMEMHLVHKAKDGEILVLGFTLEKGAANEALKPLFSNMPKKAHTKVQHDTLKIDLAALVAQKTEFYNYSGSFTTPPGTENVRWYVAQTPISASKKQIKTFQKIYNNNYRPVQPLNGRTIKLSH